MTREERVHRCEACGEEFEGEAALLDHLYSVGRVY